jgi:tetratricopeptide (TPR) repeat protein
MLFDLRGRGRRRTVQAIYLSLAILMGGGLVLFGVGGATSGGLLDALKSNNSTTSNNDLFKQRVGRAESAVRLRPTDAKAWAELTRARYLQAGTDFNQTQGTFTDAGKARLRGAQQAWDKYLSLAKKPDDTLASLMVQAFGPAGLSEPDKAVSAMEVIVDARPPTAQLYVQLAALAYEAGQTRKAELASKKAIEIAPKDLREQIKAQLQAARTAASSSLGGVGTQTTGTATTPTGTGATTTPSR